MKILVMSSILLWAGLYDLKEHKIPNRLIWSGWICGLGAKLYEAGVWGIACFAVCILLPVLAGMPLFHIRGIGAGDIKLISVVSGLYGLRFACNVTVFFFCFAGFFSLCRLCKKRALWGRLQKFLLFVRYGMQEDARYYHKDEDEKVFVIPMAPFFAAAYYTVLLVDWQ